MSEADYNPAKVFEVRYNERKEKWGVLADRSLETEYEHKKEAEEDARSMAQEAGSKTQLALLLLFKKNGDLITLSQYP